MILNSTDSFNQNFNFFSRINTTCATKFFFRFLEKFLKFFIHKFIEISMSSKPKIFHHNIQPNFHYRTFETGDSSSIQIIEVQLSLKMWADLPCVIFISLRSVALLCVYTKLFSNFISVFPRIFHRKKMCK